MKDISIYFQPVENNDAWKETQLGAYVNWNGDEFPELNKKSCAIFCVNENRGADSTQTYEYKAFRDRFYSLHVGRDWNLPIYDLGEILPGNNLKDTYFALSNVVGELVKHDVLPIIIGGSQDLIYSVYKGYQGLEQMVNICSVDYTFDLGNIEEEVNSNGYLSQIMMERPCYLFNHANIGLQIPYADKKEFELFERLYFDVCRLGEFNADFRIAEPHLRNADIINIDFDSIRASEINDNNANPNGFYNEQICQIARYAGIADKVTSFCVFNTRPTNQLRSSILAEIVWYFIDGVAARQGDFPVGSKAEYKKFRVILEEQGYELTFYKSHKSGRWWMEVPYPPTEGRKYERHYVVPCNKADYENAMKNEIPDLWWKTYHKLS